MIINLELHHFIKHTSESNFAEINDRISQGRAQKEKIPQVPEIRNDHRLVQTPLDWMSLILQNWVGVALLLQDDNNWHQCTNEKPSVDEIKEKFDKDCKNLDAWRTRMVAFNVGISLELGFLSILCYFGGFVGLSGDKMKFNAEEFFKREEWGESGQQKVKTARNVAFDLTLLSFARHLRLDAGKTQRKTAVVTRDKFLYTLIQHLSLAEFTTDDGRHGAGIYLPNEMECNDLLTFNFLERFPNLMRPEDGLGNSTQLLSAIQIISEEILTSR